MSKNAADILLAGLLSSVFCALLVQHIMAGGVGESISFAEFLSTPANTLYSVLMSLFIFASWFMKGINNRVLLLCWATILVVYSLVFWWAYDYFYYKSLNIYVLFMVGIIASIPGVLVVRYRIFLSILLLPLVIKLGLFKKQISRYLNHIRATDFEVNMEMIMYIAFSVQFLYSAYMITYGVINQIPFDGSITEHLTVNNAWDPIFIYHRLLELVTLTYILNILWYLYRDNTHPDAYLHGFTSDEQRAASLKVLEKYRKKANKD